MAPDWPPTHWVASHPWLQERTAQLTRSVEELRTLGEVGQAGSSPLDVQEVLQTIVSHATRLSQADGGTIYELDETGPRVRPSRRPPDAGRPVSGRPGLTPW